MAEGILLVGHGSRATVSNAQFLGLAERVELRLPGSILQPCFLDHAEPGIPEGIDRLAAQGVSGIAVVPLLLLAAGHAKHDLPAYLKEARSRHPRIALRYGRVLGRHPALLRICARHLAAFEAADAALHAETAVLLIGRGSSDPEANAELCAIARLLWEQTGHGLVETAYSDVTSPRVGEGVARCLKLGARRVILLPYFLFQGVLMERLQALVEHWQSERPDAEFFLAGAGGLGEGPELVDLVRERAEEAVLSGVRF